MITLFNFGSIFLILAAVEYQKPIVFFVGMLLLFASILEEYDLRSRVQMLELWKEKTERR